MSQADKDFQRQDDAAPALCSGGGGGELALIRAPRRTKCPACKGLGQRIEHAMTVRRCLMCDGRGRVVVRNRL